MPPSSRTPEQCAEEIRRHLATGIHRIIFVPYRYEREQAERLANEVLPLLAATVQLTEGQ